MKYTTICEVAAAFKSGELDKDRFVMMIDNDESTLIDKQGEAGDEYPWVGEAPLNATAATCDALGIPNEGV